MEVGVVRMRRMVILVGVSSLVCTCPVLSKHHFRRVYRRSRTVVVRRRGRVEKLPTNTYYSAYDETVWTFRGPVKHAVAGVDYPEAQELGLPLLPRWNVRTIANNRGLRYLRRVTDHNRDLHLSPVRRVSPRRPNPVAVERVVRVEDYLDSFERRRKVLKGYRRRFKKR